MSAIDAVAAPEGGRPRRRAEVGAGLAPIFVDLPTAAWLLSISESAVQKLVRDEDLPAPRQITKGRVGWRLVEIEAWAAERPVSSLPPPPNTKAGRPRTDQAAG